MTRARRGQLLSLLLAGWAFYYWPQEMLWPRVVMAPGFQAMGLYAAEIKREDGFVTLRACESAAVLLERQTRWRVMTSQCVPLE